MRVFELEVGRSGGGRRYARLQDYKIQTSQLLERLDIHSFNNCLDIHYSTARCLIHLQIFRIASSLTPLAGRGGGLSYTGGAVAPIGPFMRLRSAMPPEFLM